MECINNQTIVRDFFKAIINVMSKNTSVNYSALVLNNLKERLIKDFKFSEAIHIKGNLIKVDIAINSIDGKRVGKFLAKVVDLIGPNFLMVLLAKKLSTKDIQYLEKLGLKFG